MSLAVYTIVVLTGDGIMIMALPTRKNRNDAETAQASAIPLGVALTQAVLRIDTMCHRKYVGEYLFGLATGYNDLDQLTSGIQPGKVIVIASRPSMGKTALALNIADYIGVELQLPVLVFSPEISAPQLAVRFLSARSKIDVHRLSTGRLTSQERKELAVAEDKLKNAPIQIDERVVTMDEFYDSARFYHQKHGKLGLIVIDSVEMISAPSHERQANELALVSKLIKKLAKELSVPVIVLSGLSRKIEHRKDHRPRLSDFRKASRPLVQIADLVILLYRHHYYEKRLSQPDIAEVVLCINKNGPVGTVELEFTGECCRFEPMKAIL